MTFSRTALALACLALVLVSTTVHAVQLGHLLKITARTHAEILLSESGAESAGSVSESGAVAGSESAGSSGSESGSESASAAKASESSGGSSESAAPAEGSGSLSASARSESSSEGSSYGSSSTSAAPAVGSSGSSRSESSTPSEMTSASPTHSSGGSSDDMSRRLADLAQREREADAARAVKDAQEQAAKRERLTQLEIQEQLKRAKRDAEIAARKIIADAQARAVALLATAKKRREKPLSDKEQQALDAKNAIMLKPVNTAGPDAVDPQKLGLAPTMSVDTNVIRRGEFLSKRADVRHERFEDQHEIDCRGPICPAARGFKVNADAV